jgi:hypothetical protein
MPQMQMPTRISTNLGVPVCDCTVKRPAMSKQDVRSSLENLKDSVGDTFAKLTGGDPRNVKKQLKLSKKTHCLDLSYFKLIEPPKKFAKRLDQLTELNLAGNFFPVVSHPLLLAFATKDSFEGS